MVALGDQHSIEAGVALAETIVDAIADPFRLSRGVVEIGASIGVAMSAPTGAGPTDVDDLLRRADRALYRAKSDGGSTVARATVTSDAST